jgi:osmotically inducible lipoprotein OsmB
MLCNLMNGLLSLDLIPICNQVEDGFHALQRTVQMDTSLESGRFRVGIAGAGEPTARWRMASITVLALVALLALGACGTSTQDRALSGGAIGAAAGGAAGLLLDEPLAGALLGGAAGAAAGAFTDEDQIDLGKPVWR